MPKIITQPSEKAVFLIATAGVTFALLALLFVNPIEAKSGEGNSNASGGSATSQPSSQPTSQPADSSSANAPAKPAVQAIKSNTSSQTAKGVEASNFPTEKYDDLLKAHLSDGSVDYQKLTTSGKAELEELVTIIENTSTSSVNNLPEAEFIAWYINAYNILTLDTIADNYPLDSITNLDQPWDTPLTVANQQLSLNNIEHQILRKIDEPEAERIAFMDPRLHFAVNCAAIGCPILQDTAFTAGNTEELYKAGALEFLNNPQRVRLENGTLYLSQLMDWYGDDFYLIYKDEAGPIINKLRSQGVSNPEKIGSVAYFFSTIAEENMARDLINGNYKSEWIEYDWKLNSQN